MLLNAMTISAEELVIIVTVFGIIMSVLGYSLKMNISSIKTNIALLSGKFDVLQENFIIHKTQITQERFEKNEDRIRTLENNQNACQFCPTS